MELVGFKCSRCHRKRIPVCPYTDPETRKKLEAKKKLQFKSKKQTNLGSDSNSETNDEQVNDWELDSNSVFDTKEAVNVQENNPLCSFPMVEPVTI